MKIIVALLIIISCLKPSFEIVIPGKCHDIAAIKNFNAVRYLGYWYEIARFNYIFEDTLKCLRAEYEVLNSTAISVHNIGISIVNGKQEGTQGYAYVPDSNAPNKLLVRLPIVLFNQTVIENTATYDVIQTDYTTFALVYSCLEIIPSVIKEEVVWILARAKTLDQKIVDNLVKVLIGLNINTKPLTFVAQDCNITSNAI